MIRNATLAAALLLGLAACATALPGPPPIPAMPDERVPRPPASTMNLIWRPGHYDWDGAAYRWIPGEWVPSEGHGRLWQDGMWQRSGSTWAWLPGHWI